MYLARLISQQKWRARNGMSAADIPSDAVTTDLRSTGNALSFWSCVNADPSTLENVVIALASARDSVQRLDLVWLEEKHVKTLDVGIKEVAGETPAKSLAATHRDIVGIDLYRLFGLSELVDIAIKKQQARRFSEAEVQKILTKALTDNVIELSSLKRGVALKLAPHARLPATEIVMSHMKAAESSIGTCRLIGVGSDHAFADPNVQLSELTKAHEQLDSAIVVLKSTRWVT